MQNVEIDLQSNRVTITPRAREFSLASIPERIEAAGFTPDDMYIVARGTVVQNDGKLQFQIAHWNRLYPLQTEDPPDGPTTLRASVDFEQDPPVLTPRK